MDFTEASRKSVQGDAQMLCIYPKKVLKTKYGFLHDILIIAFVIEYVHDSFRDSRNVWNRSTDHV